MENEEKRRWLRRYRQALRDEDCIRERIRVVRSRAESTTQALQPVSGSGNQSGSKIERGAELLNAYQNELLAQLERSQGIRREIEDAISGLEDPMQRDVLQSLYIDGLPVWKTANRLYISERWVKSKHRAGLEALEIVPASSPLPMVL
nr:hypothetical protein [uncultured Gemmiger sp.]